MAIDFGIDGDLVELRARVGAFVRDVALPAEAVVLASGHGPDDDLRRHLQATAADAGLLAPCAPAQWGGLGLDMRAQSLVLEEAGYSLLGPLALNCAAPDEGNMHLLAKVADPAQQKRYLAPLVTGEIRSCFAMTEPAPGAGSDPSSLATTAERVAGGWVVNGRKWFITGAAGAAVAICMARTGDGSDGRPRATMFLVDAGTPGMRIERNLTTLDHGFVGGHGVVLFEDCLVTDDAVLGEVDEGFRYAQVRLAPARLTHCMRWLGLARRAQEMALEHASGRDVFGRRLAEHGMAHQLLADSEIDLAASRALIQHAAWTLDTGGDGRTETSIAKTFVAEAVNRIVDRSVQLHGAMGVSDETPLGRFANEVRAFRIYDGPSEVHRYSIARRAVKEMATRRTAAERR